MYLSLMDCDADEVRWIGTEPALRAPDTTAYFFLPLQMSAQRLVA